MISEQLPDPSPEQPEGLNTRIRELDSSRQNLLDCAQKYAKLPIKRKQHALAAAAQNMFDTFKDATETVTKLDGSEDEKRQIIVTLLATDDSERVDGFNKITGTSAFQKFQPELLEYIKINGCTPPQEDSEVKIMDMDEWLSDILENYSVYLGNETGMLINNVNANKAKWLELGSMVGKQGLDIAKIAGSVAIGIHLAKKMNKH